MRKFIFFDFDGVLHNTFEFHLERIENILGVALTEEEYRAMHDGNFYKEPSGKTKQVDWVHYTKSIEAEQRKLEMRPDVYEHIQQLAEEYSLLLVSSGGRGPIEGYLEKNGALQYFVDGLYREDSLSKLEKFETLFARYDAHPTNSMFVTDTLGDILEAHEVGLRSIGVSFGFHNKERLEKGNPYKVVDAWEEIPEAISEAFSSV